MFAYVLSPDALQDLQDIWDFVALDNVNAADRLEHEFFEAFNSRHLRSWPANLGWDTRAPI
jgi:plasmid stabilization system protein ParE